MKIYSNSLECKSKQKQERENMVLGKIDSNKRSGLQRVRELDSITDSIDMNLNKIWEKVKG